jgi:hypothetical protein
MPIVHGPICPLHLAFSLSLVILVKAFVYVSRSPGEHTLPMFLVIQIFSFILIGGVLFVTSPLAHAVFQAILEAPDVDRSICPAVLTLPIRFPILIGASVNISVGKDVCSLSMLETTFPLSLISVSALPYVNSMSFSLAVAPLANV